MQRTSTAYTLRRAPHGPGFTVSLRTTLRVCTGEITSRLSADTTTVSDQICLNLNVGLRSLTQASMVLVFMFKASWRLTIITFILIPLIILVCKVYGAYYR